MCRKVNTMDKSLSAYMKREGVSICQLAKRANVPKSGISRLLSGKGGITMATARKLEAATGGVVSVSDP